MVYSAGLNLGQSCWKIIMLFPYPLSAFSSWPEISLTSSVNSLHFGQVIFSVNLFLRWWNQAGDLAVTLECGSEQLSALCLGGHWACPPPLPLGCRVPQALSHKQCLKAFGSRLISFKIYLREQCPSWAYMAAPEVVHGCDAVCGFVSTWIPFDCFQLRKKKKENFNQKKAQWYFHSS